jgi:hypothetical protein
MAGVWFALSKKNEASSDGDVGATSQSECNG